MPLEEQKAILDVFGEDEWLEELKAEGAAVAALAEVGMMPSAEKAKEVAEHAAMLTLESTDKRDQAIKAYAQAAQSGEDFKPYDKALIDGRWNAVGTVFRCAQETGSIRAVAIEALGGLILNNIRVVNDVDKEGRVDILVLGLSSTRPEVRRRALNDLRLFFKSLRDIPPASGSNYLDWFDTDDRDVQEAFFTDDVLSVCIQALGDEDVLVKQHAAHLLSELTAKDDGDPTGKRAKRVIENGAVSALVKCLTSVTTFGGNDSPENIRVQELVITALYQVMGHCEARAFALDAWDSGLVAVWLEYWDTHLETLKEPMIALWRTVVPVDLDDTRRSQLLSEFVGFLSCVSEDKRGKRVSSLFEKGFITDCVQWLSVCAAKTQKGVALLLRHCIDGPEAESHCLRLRKEGGMKALLRLLYSTDDDVRQESIKVLARLLYHATREHDEPGEIYTTVEACARMLSEGAVPVLLSYAGSGSEEEQKLALGAVNLIVLNGWSRYCSRTKKAEALKALIAHLKTLDEGEAKAYCERMFESGLMYHLKDDAEEMLGWFNPKDRTLIKTVFSFDVATWQRSTSTEEMGSVLIVSLQSDNKSHQGYAERAVSLLASHCGSSFSLTLINYSRMVIVGLINGTSRRRRAVIAAIEESGSLPGLLKYLRDYSAVHSNEPENVRRRVTVTDALVRLARNEVSRAACYQIIFNDRDGLPRVNSMLESNHPIVCSNGLQLLYCLLSHKPDPKSVADVFKNKQLKKTICALARQGEDLAHKLLHIMANAINTDEGHDTSLAIFHYERQTPPPEAAAAAGCGIR